MVNDGHLAAFKQGLEGWNRWRKQNPGVQVSLESVDLRGVDLQHFNLSRVILHCVDLNGSDLSGADLRRATLRGATLRGARLRTANLTRADLLGADFSGADLTEAIVDQAVVGSTCFGDVDLSEVRGLESVEHRAPSTIGIDTVYRSKGNISEAFLRGAGVPESFIAYMSSLVGKPFDFYSCFISHSSKDKRFCDRLHADLQADGVRSWYFPEDAKWGESVWGEIDRGIRVYDKLIVVCSEHSLRSGPVLREIERSLNREDREGKNVLFPIRIDNYLFEDWEHERKADLTRKVVGDFRGWDRSASKYEVAFKRLVAALRAGE